MRALSDPDKIFVVLQLNEMDKTAVKVGFMHAAAKAVLEMAIELLNSMPDEDDGLVDTFRRQVAEFGETAFSPEETAKSLFLLARAAAKQNLKLGARMALGKAAELVAQLPEESRLADEIRQALAELGNR